MFGIADATLFAGYANDGRDHDNTLQGVLQICRKDNLKLNKDKWHFWWTVATYCGEIISWQGVRPDLTKLKALTDMPPLKSKKELQASLGIIKLFK